MTIPSKVSNKITSVDGHRATVQAMGKETEQMFVNPTTGTTANMGSRIEFSVDLDTSAGRVLKDLYIRYKFKNIGSTTSVLSRYPLIEAIQEVRINPNNSGNYYQIQGGQDANQLYHLSNVNKFSNPVEFAHDKRTHGGDDGSSNINLNTDVKMFSLTAGTDSGKVHRLKLSDLLGDVFHQTETEYLKSFNISILLKSGVDAEENQQSMGTSGGTETLKQCVQFEEIEMEVLQEVHCAKLGARKPYLIRHHPYVESKAFSVSPSSKFILNLRNEFSPLKNIQYIIPLIKSQANDSAGTSYADAHFKKYVEKVEIRRNGQVYRRFKTMNDLEDCQHEYRKSAGIHSQMPPSGNSSGMDAISRVDGFMPMSRTSQRYHAETHELINGIENSSSSGNSDWTVEFTFNSTVPTDAKMIVNLVATRSYSLGNRSVGHKVEMER